MGWKGVPKVEHDYKFKIIQQCDKTTETVIDNNHR